MSNLKYFLDNFGKNPHYTIAALLDSDYEGVIKLLFGAEAPEKNRLWYQKNASTLKTLSIGDQAGEIVAAAKLGEIEIPAIDTHKLVLRKGSVIHSALIEAGMNPNQSTAGAKSFGEIMGDIGSGIGGFVGGIISPILSPIVGGATQILGTPGKVTTTGAATPGAQQQQQKKDNTLTWIIIGGAALLIIIILIIIFSKKS